MATPMQAEAIHEYIRIFFKHSAKSSNKFYDDDFKKFDSRFKEAFAAHALITKLYAAPPGTTVAAYGERVAAQAGDDPCRMRDGENRAGNCLEMAAMAVALAERVPDFGPAWLCGIERPGDHAFCAIGVQRAWTPAWHNVREMSGSGNAVWVIDPWANVCCPAQQYPARFLAKMDAWTRQGKLIPSKKFDLDDLSRDVNFTQVEPGRPWYTNAFLDGPLRFKSANAPVF